MKKTVILGFDPGFAAFGVARVSLRPDGEDVLALDVIVTEKSDRKREVRATDDNLRRMADLTTELDRMLTPDVLAICSESQSWPRSAGVVAKVGMAWGVIGALATLRGIPILQASPQEIKKRVAGSKSASKEDVQGALEARYDALPAWPRQATRVEHAADALAAVVACLDHPTIMLARRLGW